MLANIDNGEDVDISNNWSIGRRTHHMEVKQIFLWKFKEAHIIEPHWVSMANNESDMFTQNVMGSELSKHAANMCRHYKYYNPAQDAESYEQRRVSGVAEHSQLEKGNRSRRKNSAN